ncbi:MAG: ATP-binding protein [Nitrospirota bacterium]
MKPSRRQETNLDGRAFDLNIEKILENWETYHAVREVIANAIDEEVLTGTKPMRIYKEGETWHIQDFGRGLKYEHLTQKENDEKLKDPRVIGKFGIGLKDALATFDRRRVGVVLRSKHGDIRIGKSEKHGFKDLITLHAYVDPPSDPNLVGTDVILSGCREADIEKAKDLFLRFSGERIVEDTKDGQVLATRKGAARIYVNGVKVAEEENFLFSYNITSINKAIKHALNRERTNVGRTAYTDRVKAILLASKDRAVADALVDDLKGFESGALHDELKWTDVSVHACRILNSAEKVVFFTPGELVTAAGVVEKARGDGYRIVTVPDNIRDKIKGMADIAGEPIRDLGQFQHEWNESFQFRFVAEKELTAKERRIFQATSAILSLGGGRPKAVKDIRVSETMRMNPVSFQEAEGLWEPSTGRIIIKRSALKSLVSYAGTLLHEVGHARSGAPDVSEAFEEVLTRIIGTVTSNAMETGN